jgi:hypothetical protein
MMYMRKYTLERTERDNQEWKIQRQGQHWTQERRQAGNINTKIHRDTVRPVYKDRMLKEINSQDIPVDY